MYCRPPLSPDEPIRLKSLRQLNIVETPLEERFERLTRLTQRLLCVPIAAISFIETDRQWFKSIQGCTLTETSRDISFCGHAILQDDVFMIEDARRDERFRENPLVTGEQNIVFYAGAPIHAEDGSHIGVLCVKDHQPRKFGEGELDSLRDMAQLVESELRSASSRAVQASLIEHYSAESRKARIDALTRVWNRMGIEEIATESLRRTAIGQGATAFVVLDLDGFKLVNDTYGHAAGDEALRIVAKRAIAMIRSTDSIGRLGGDEFLAIVTPCESVCFAEGLARHMHAAIISEPLRLDTVGAMIEIGASLGVRIIPNGTQAELGDVLHSADRAMYQSKGAGKNRVTTADSDAPPPAAAA